MTRWGQTLEQCTLYFKLKPFLTGFDQISDAHVKYREISNSEGTFIIKTFAVSTLWALNKKIGKIRAKMNEQMSVCPFQDWGKLDLGVARANQIKNW